MKIGFLIRNFYPQTGGAENNCYYLARELAEKHKVHVFCSGERDSEEVIDKIRIHRCKRIFSIKYYLTFYPSLTKKLKKYNLDILHVHGLGFIQNDLAISKLNKNKKIKIVCTPHGPFMALKDYNIFGKIFKKIYTKIVKKAIKRYDNFIQVNPFQYRWMKKEYNIPERKVRFLPNGIPKETFRKVKKLEKYNLKNKFIITYLGRIQRYKGLEQVIKSLPEIKKVEPGILFVAMGKDVGDKNRLKKLAKKLKVEENILFLGIVSEKKKLAFLDKSEIFIFPSEWEAFGIVMLEAMARKNAIISTRTEGGKYLIKEGNGFLFDYNNVKKLTSHLRKLVKSKRLRKEIQKNNYKKSKNFLWSKIALDLEKIYMNIK